LALAVLRYAGCPTMQELALLKYQPEGRGDQTLVITSSSVTFSYSGRTYTFLILEILLTPSLLEWLPLKQKQDCLSQQEKWAAGISCSLSSSRFCTSENATKRLGTNEKWPNRMYQHFQIVCQYLLSHNHP
jgi:hypothetical protein